MIVAFATLGCRVNQYESEAMIEKFLKEGYSLVDFDVFADVYVINTCTVTNMGDKKSRQMISRARRLNPLAVIAVVGCYSQIAPEEVSKLQGVDVVLGTRNKGDVVYWVNRFKEERVKVIKVDEVIKNTTFENLNIDKYQDKTRAFLKIQDGCNRFCSYCMIPFARGAVCSKDPLKILEEVKELAANGFKEIILSGIHTASYGVDLKESITLVDIIEAVDKIPGIERIRIGSIDPTFFTEGVVERITKLKNLCPHFHLSLQSGSLETLIRMNRRYTPTEYSDIVNILRKNILNVAITTDVIVGFPGETNEEFESTFMFLSEIKLSKIHVFKYSPRKGTKAAKMSGQIDGTVKDIRSNRLIELSHKQEEEFMEGFVGSKTKVLFEEKVKGTDSFYAGYTPNYIRVVVESKSDISGKLLEVSLVRFENEHIFGLI